MRKSNRWLLILAFLLALLGTGVLYVFLANRLDDVPKLEEEKYPVIAAKEDILPYTLIQVNQLEVIWVSDLEIANQYAQTIDQVEGTYAKAWISKGAMIHPDALQRENIRRLGFKIEKGHRAMSLLVNGSTGVSALLEAGDHVDLIVYLPELLEQGRVIRPDVTKLFLQKIRVLAIDQDYEGESDLPNENIVPFHVTLSIPIEQVEAFVLAKDIGIIDLALRPVGEMGTMETSGYVWQNFLPYFEQGGVSDED